MYKFTRPASNFIPNRTNYCRKRFRKRFYFRKRFHKLKILQEKWGCYQEVF